MSSLFNTLFERGGPVILILIGMSLIATTIISAKLWQFAATRVGRHGMAKQAVDEWISGNRSHAYDLVYGDSSPVSTVLAHAMRGVSLNKRDGEVREDVTRVATQTLHGLQSYIRALDTVAQTAPLLGLFGTVLGMIETFGALETAGASVDPSQLAGGIWVALLTTAVGLAVAMPCGVLASWFEGQLENERTVMETMLTGFFTEFATDEHAGLPRDRQTISSGV